MDEKSLVDWVNAYVRAWNSNDSGEIGSLFSEDAVYLTGPYDEPWRGRKAIVDEWLANKDEPGQTEFTFEVLAIDGDIGIVEGRTKYFDEPPREYANLWVIRRTSDGSASAYTEWFMEKK